MIRAKKRKGMTIGLILWRDAPCTDTVIITNSIWKLTIFTLFNTVWSHVFTISWTLIVSSSGRKLGHLRYCEKWRKG